MTCWLSDCLFLIYVFLLHPFRQNYAFLQVGFQHLAYEKREDVPSYGLERLFGKSNTDIYTRSRPVHTNAFSDHHRIIDDSR